MTEDTFTGTEMEYPPGAIMLWHSTELPPGWVFCDGNNGTVDLRGKYPKCVPDGNTDPGGSGGQHSYVLAEAQLPSHSHSITDVADSGGHTHTFTSGEITAEGSDYSADYWDSSGGKSQGTSTDGEHNHTLSVDSTGSDSSIDNEPRYREARFIQKL